MAEQKSILKLQGKMGGISFYYHSPTGKWVARRSSTVQSEYIKTRESFKRCRENMSEFGLASKVGKDIRTVILLLGKGFTESYFSGKLNARLLKVITQNPGIKGKRSILYSNRRLLPDYPLDALQQGIQLNYSVDILNNQQALFQHITVTPKQSNELYGKLKLIMRPISDWEVSDTGYKRTHTLSAAHFWESETLPVSDLEFTNLELTLDSPAPTGSGILLVAGIELFKMENNNLHPLQEGKSGWILGCFG